MTDRSIQFRRLYRAFLCGDTSLDGQALAAVRTTGVYCLLSCRSRKPRPQNVAFYFSRAAAERDGFRPCRKCRPDVAGGRRAIERARVRRWLASLAEGETPLASVARAEGASPSRIYRAFLRHLGHGPRQARGRARLERACALLRQPQKSVTEVAYDAGFASLATFYRWFRRVLGTTPSEFRLRQQARRGQ